MAKNPRSRLLLVSRALCLALAALLWSGQASLLAAPGARVTAAATAARPAQEVAYARIAVVRVVSYYFGTVNNSAPIPILTPCVADGALVGTTGAGLNSYNYVLLPTAAINPLTPCQGAQAAFQQLNGTATGWGITSITVLLNAAYTGAETAQLGSISFTIDPAEIQTNGGPGGPPLLALPLHPSQGAPTHDLPLLALPQLSDAPASGANTLLDLTDITGSLSGRDSVAPGEEASTLYPVAVAAGTPPAASTAPVSTPTADASLSQLSLGAPEINANGRLVGMVIAGSQGSHALASLDQLKQAIGSISGKPGPLMSAWQQGIASFYAQPPQYSAAATAFGGLRQSAPDFAGVEPFLTAAQRQTSAIPSLIQTPTPTPAATAAPAPPTTTPRRLSNSLLAAIGAAAVVLLLVLLGLSLWLVRRRRTALAAAAAVPVRAPLVDPRLDLLPPDGELPPTPMEVPVVRPPTGAPAKPTSMGGPSEVSEMPTLTGLAGAPQRPSGAPGRPLPPRVTIPLDDVPTTVLATPRPKAMPRGGTSLMPLAAGVTDPGLRRKAEPNQDNLLALHGIRLNGSRPQPYGVFVIADGMGGHLHGQEASRLTIEIVTRTVMQVLTTAQPLTIAALHELIREGIQRAHDELRRRNLEERADMGTTVTAALVVDDRAVVANVGDSRTYLMNPDTGLRQITTDHSVVASLVSAGVIRPDDMYSHPRRNQIYRSLGGDEPQIEIDTFEVPLQAGDKLLLCSDGLWEMVRNPQIAQIVRATADPGQAAALLVREANTNGGEDNISVVVVRLVEEVPQGAQPGVRILAAPERAQILPPR